jgi:hypothetical protein
MFALIGEKTAVLYDLASDVSVSMDAEALAGALSSGGGAAGLMEEDVLRSLGATTTSQAALMDSEDKYKELFEELLQFRGPLLSILDFVESIVDKLADNRIKEMKALEKQIELAQEDYDATLAMMKNLEKSGSTSGRMYQKLSKGLEKYQSLRNKTLADLQEMMASNHLGRIQTILKDVRAGLLTYSPDSHFAGKAYTRSHDHLHRRIIQPSGRCNTRRRHDFHHARCSRPHELQRLLLHERQARYVLCS